VFPSLPIALPAAKLALREAICAFMRAISRRGSDLNLVSLSFSLFFPFALGFLPTCPVYTPCTPYEGQTGPLTCAERP
jgi:hypothetical protein